MRNNNSYTEIYALADLASDTSAPALRRMTAAKDCLWLVQRLAATEPTVTLTRALLSRSVDDLKAHQVAAYSFDDFEFWRRFPATSDNRLDNIQEMQPDHTLLCAQLLFDSGRHEMALPYFDRALGTTPSADTVILACYNLEVLGRQRNDITLVEHALDLLTQRYAHVVVRDRYAAEIDHLSGHLLLLKGRFSETEALGYEKLGVQRLLRATHADPSYTGCYVSSFSEYGDFLGSVDACLWAAREKPFRSLTPREATLVELEVTFYLAYALMAVGELERAKMCFESFAEVSGRLGLFEARDHARLF